MIHTVTHVEDEVIEREIEGVIVRLTKRHVVQLPVEITIDTLFRHVDVKADPEQVDVSCLIVADVVGLAPVKFETLVYDLAHGHPQFTGYAH